MVRVDWALDAGDVCSIVELAFYLFREWQPHSPRDAWNRTARLLGPPVLLEAPTTATSFPAGGAESQDSATEPDADA